MWFSALQSQHSPVSAEPETTLLTYTHPPHCEFPQCAKDTCSHPNRKYNGLSPCTPTRGHTRVYQTPNSSCGRWDYMLWYTIHQTTGSLTHSGTTSPVQEQIQTSEWELIMTKPCIPSQCVGSYPTVTMPTQYSLTSSKICI